MLGNANIMMYDDVCCDEMVNAVLCALSILFSQYCPIIGHVEASKTEKYQHRGQ